MPDKLAFNKFLPFVLLYFFFNSVFLPFGLLYTMLLSPLFIFWMYRHKHPMYFGFFGCISLTWAAIHYANGIHIFYYARSYVLLVSAYIFCLVCYRFIQHTKQIDTIFKHVLILNGYFVLFAIITYPILFIRTTLWSFIPISRGLENIPRLQLWTYEPSYYSLLMAPLVIYFALKILLYPIKKWFLTVVFITIPLLLSFSFGIIGALGLSFALMLLIHARTFIRYKRIVWAVGSILILSISSFALLQLLIPDNPLVKRIINVSKGLDTSAKGRTTGAFMIGSDIAEMRSKWFGVGLGQTKLLAPKLPYYKDYNEETLRIPNTIAELLAVYGLLGVFLKLFLEIWLFFRTKVFKNYYRLSLFIFMFIYQFTGSFVLNIAELSIWVLAFSPAAFTLFDKNKFQPIPKT
ncbi:MAG: hypothetical protein GY810_03285 [Aureispira sp.]|nr:hypothetical protein [Aureispira sp.]